MLLYLGRLDAVQRSAPVDQFYQDIGREGDRARQHLLLAEVARRQADLGRCLSELTEAARWILHSGSVEHLCLFHLITSHRERAATNLEAARRATDEGLHVAGQCGLGLYHVELLCEQAEVFMAAGDLPAAEQSAREALRRASAPKCQFVWGAADAGHMLGQILWNQQRGAEARAILARTLSLRRRIGHPGVELTELLLKQAAGSG
jgi:hypothetical protein